MWWMHRNSNTFQIGMGAAHEIENFELYMRQINNDFDDNDDGERVLHEHAENR